MSKVMFKPITGQTRSVSISGTSAKTVAPLTSGNVRLLATVDCFVRFGAQGGTAVVTDMPLLAATPEYFNLDGYDTVAAITSGASGTLYVTEVN